MSTEIATQVDVSDLLNTPAEAQVARTSEDGGDDFKQYPAYVGFRGKKTEKNVEALEAAGIKVNTFYLFDAGIYTPLVPCDLHLLGAPTKIYTLTDQDNVIEDVSYEDTKEQFDAGFRSQIYATVAVPMGDGFVPATLMLRSGQTNALRDAMKLIEKDGAATDPKKWAAKGGDAFAKSAAVTFPGGRFKVRIRNEYVEDGKYNKGHGTILPTPPESVAALNAFVAKGSPSSLKIALAIGHTQSRISNCRKIYEAKRVEEAAAQG